MTAPTPPVTNNAARPEKQTPQFSFLAKLWPYLSRYRLTMVGAAIALLLTSAITLALGQGVRLVIDQGILANSTEQLNLMLLAMFALIVLMAVGSSIRFFLVTVLGEKVSADLRNDLFAHLISLHPSYFEENQSGEIMSRLTTDTTLLQTIIGSSLSFALRNALTVTGGLIMLLVTNLKLSLVVMVGVPMVLIPLIWMGRRVRDLSRESQDTVADVGSYAGESIRQVKTVQAYHRQGFEVQSFGGEVTRALRVAKRRILNRAVFIALVMLLAFSAIAIMIWIGGNDVMRGVMTGGELAAFVFYAMMVAFGVAGVSEVYGEVQRAAGATDRLFELLEEETEISNPAAPKLADKTVSDIVRFDRVSFSYPSRPDTLALNNLNFAVRRRETVALVGESGAGKSTVFELMLRFYDPKQGSIKIFGKDVRDLSLGDLREPIALVPQQPTLFSQNVWYNIRYGKPDATDEQVIEAAKAAYAYDFIQQLPEGFDSDLGESGVRLSGGQRQRIAIARAILSDPDILLLDEATSALDAESEFAVQNALTRLQANRTTLIIAHRLSTVVNADRIILMKQGELLAQGTHEYLLANSAEYKRLADLQFNSESRQEMQENR